MNLQTLEKVAQHKLDPLDAYILEARKDGSLKRARFVTWRMKVDEMPVFLRGVVHSLSAFPLPLGIAKFALKRLPKEATNTLEPELLMKLLRYSKGTMINIESDGVNIQIKVR